MLNSQFEYLRSPNSITIAAGHGGRDPGAVFGGDVEAQDTIFMTKRIADNLRRWGVEVNLVPDDLDLVGAINYINSKFQWGQTWALEIHRDSAGGISQQTPNTRTGVYGFGQYTGQDGKFYNEDVRSMSIARFMRDKMVQLGAEVSSWARPDSVATYGRLGWIRDTKPAAHLIELGFVQGLYTPEHLTWLADIASVAIYEAFTGKTAPSGTTNSNNNSNPTPNMSEADKISVAILGNYRDLPLDIPSLQNLWTQHSDQALDQILASFRKNLTEFRMVSLQKDQWIAERDQSIISLQNSKGTASPQLDQIRQELAISNQQRENYRLQLANLVSNYDQLQTELANLKRGSVTPLNASLTTSGFSRTSLASFNGNSTSGANTPQQNLQVPIQNMNQPVNQSGINSSNKPFWQSKKFGANLLNTVSSIALITWQTAQIKPEDDWAIIGTKLGTALAGVLGISFVSNQYIRAQGKVDEASFAGVATNILQQFLKGGK